MSDFVSGFWGYYIAAVVLLGIVWCLWLLFSQRKWLVTRSAEVKDTGHVWDGDLRELNNPVPRWWTMMYVIMCLFGLGYLVLYPGLGAFDGSLGYTSAQEVRQDQADLNAQVKPVYEKFAKMDIPSIAADVEARVIGQRLFLNNCAQCHGSDAGGSKGFPNLSDRDWLYGGEPADIRTTILQGRAGVMPAFAHLSGVEQSDVANYVRNMAGLAADQLKSARGAEVFKANCAACHGGDGKGNPAMGAPNLTDKVWLYGGSEASIIETIAKGRNGMMPAHQEILTPEKVHLLTAYVWGLSNQKVSADSQK